MRRKERRRSERRDVAIFEAHCMDKQACVGVGICESIPVDVDFVGAVGAGQLDELSLVEVEVVDKNERRRHGGAADLMRAREGEGKHDSLVPEGT